MVIEIACNQFQSCVNAMQGGAHRIELFENLAEGGCTPSIGMLEKVREVIHLPIYVMIRPRGGDFNYSSDEIEIMSRDIRLCKKVGVDGIVFGILDRNKNVNTDAYKRLLDTWGNDRATFHRAFDNCVQLEDSLEKIIQTGFERVLTSGGKENVELGKETIKNLQSTYGKEIIIMPGAGVTPFNAKKIADYCLTSEIHATCKTYDANKQVWYSSVECVQSITAVFM